MTAVSLSARWLVDTHAHLDDHAFDADRAEVIQRAADSGVAIITVGVDVPSSEAAVALTARHEHVWAAVGVHPHDARTLTAQTLDHLRQLCREARVVAIGETGLDWYRNLSPRDCQLEAFAAQLALAAEVGLPVIVHNRDADDDVLRVWRSVPGLRGVLHAFSSGIALADTALAAGLHIALGGPLTFKNAPERRAVAAHVPLERLLVETDCPYLAPAPWWGRRNEPAYVGLVAEALAQARGATRMEVAQATTGNAAALFSLPFRA